MPVIENEIPLPEKAGPGRVRYPELRELQIGQSVFYANAKRYGEANRIRVAVYYLKQRYNRIFVTRIENDGIRVWRKA